MIDALVLLRLRRFLLFVSASLFVGTVVELFLVNHMESFAQLIPFALCGLGLVSVVAVLLRPQRALMLALRACMSLVAAGSLFGIYEHIEGNLGFQRELHPNAAFGKVVLGALGGANPLLAPGILALAAALALAATYYHPALAKARKEEKRNDER
jgi:hypothetical protein